MLYVFVHITCFCTDNQSNRNSNRQNGTGNRCHNHGKNSTNGTVTDIDGRYRLEASIGDILTFSFVGYNTVEKEVKSNNPMINVELTDDVQAIDEVVVTAIGIKQQKKKIGYTTQQINSDVLNATPSLNVGSALSGQVAGLLVANPTGIFQAPSFKLRGNTPLIVLDGVPVETDFFDISSENIESVNVLKGTAASALYGSRGKNGAILITSKTAKKEGLEINFSTNNMITAGFAVLPETQHQYGSGSNGKYEFWDGADGGISDGDMTWGPKLNVGTKVAQWNSPIRDKVTGKEIPWWGDVKGTQYDDKSRYERVPIDWVSHDNLKDFLQTGLVTNNNISIAYKGEKARYFVTGQYAYQKDRYPLHKCTAEGSTSTPLSILLKTCNLTPIWRITRWFLQAIHAMDTDLKTICTPLLYGWETM